MRLCIIIPAHNEASNILACLDSFATQTQIPDEVILVDDNSSDATFQIASGYAKKFDWIKVFRRNSTNEHIPGKKVVDAFNFGLERASQYDLIGKFDADVVLPPNYFELMKNHFQGNWKLGICSGLLYIKKGNDWIFENIANTDHVRGPIKLYHKACFDKIGGLRPGVGWDTVDCLLAKYHDFEIRTDASLQVKHLRPTGHGYSSKNLRAKGEALYKMRYGLPLAKIALFKMALQAKNPNIYITGIFAYLWEWANQKERFVDQAEGKFIRKVRWKGILDKVF